MLFKYDMSITALALFGSRARGDNDLLSDTDLLLVTQNSKPKHILNNNLSLSFYSQEYLIEKARFGDLFLCHIINESKSLYDPNGFFDMLKNEFCFKDSYLEEVGHASELGWFLIQYSESFSNYKISNKRIAWCVRTILIARSAEKRNPIFSANKLAESIDTFSVADLINNKDDDKFDSKLLEQFAGFLRLYGGCEPEYMTNKSIRNFIKKFRISDNKVALNTVRALLSEEHLLSYE